MNLSAHPPGPTAPAEETIPYHDALLPTADPLTHFRISMHLPTNEVLVELWHVNVRHFQTFPSVDPTRTPREHREGILPADAERAFAIARALHRSAVAASA